LAGLLNLAEERGLYGTAYLSLEQLITSKPDLIIANEVHEKSPALAQQNFRHPAFRALLADTPRLSIDGRLTACGGPFTMRAVEQLNAAASALQVTEIQ
jgi:iron complex transport system substrate-binding protein